MKGRGPAFAAAVALAGFGGWMASSATQPDVVPDNTASRCDASAIGILEKASGDHIHTIEHCPSIAEAKHFARTTFAVAHH
jgi:hypothetical protein